MRAKRRWNRINAQILVWAGDERLQLKYDGVPIMLPAYNETAKKGARQPFRFESAKDGRDRFIPGTILVTDIINRTDEGGVLKTFDVGEFCDFLERDKEHYFQRGLEIVTEPGDVEAAMAAARPVWEKSQVAKAQQIISQEMDRIAAHEARGEPATKASNADRVAWAVAHLQNQSPEKATFGREELAKALSGQYVGPAEKEAPPVTAADLSTKEILAEAKSVGLKLTRSEMQALLEDDEEQIDFIQQKIKGRREAQAAPA